MAKVGIEIKIDVTKIDKARLFKGKKGTYLNLTTFIDTEKGDRFGNHGFISQSVSESEREKKIQTDILGNCRIFFNDDLGANLPSEQTGESDGPTKTIGSHVNLDNDDVPF